MIRSNLKVFIALCNILIISMTSISLHLYILLHRMKSREPRKTRGGKFDSTRNQVSYVTDVPIITKALASKSKKNLTELQRSHLMKVIEKMKVKKNKIVKKNEHKLIQQYSASGEIALQRCASASIGEIVNNFSPTEMFRSTIHTIYRAIRLAILNHDWSHCLILYVRLLHLRCLSKRNAIYILRVIIIAVLNSHIDGDEFEKLLRITFGLTNHGTRKIFLKSLFTFPEELRGPRHQKPRRSKKNKEENESVFEHDNLSPGEDDE